MAMATAICVVLFVFVVGVVVLFGVVINSLWEDS
jgi:hypothetical protein